MSEKRTEILKLLAAGKITAEEAAGLLTETPIESVKQPAPAAPPSPVHLSPPEPPKAPNGQQPKWLHIRVNDLDSGKSKVTVNIPIRMVKFGFNVGRRFASDLDDVNWDDLSKIMTEEEGILFDVQDGEDGEHVQIYVD
jgi:hypothetical protein